MFCFCFLFISKLFLSDQLFRNLPTELCQIFWVGCPTTMAVYDQSEISFLISQATLPWQLFFGWFYLQNWLFSALLWPVVQPGGLILGFTLHLVASASSSSEMLSSLMAVWMLVGDQTWVFWASSMIVYFVGYTAMLTGFDLWHHVLYWPTVLYTVGVL